MINFRYHLVSLIAVFLALALGIALGASVVDRAIVKELNRKISSVTKDKRKTDALNGQLRDEINRDDRVLASLVPAAVQGRLTDRPVAVFAVRGVDSKPVKDLVDALQLAGADAPAVIWLEDKWALPDDATRQVLATALGISVSSDLRDVALRTLARRVLHPAAALAGTGPSSTTTTTSPRDRDVLATLADAGFVSVERAGAGGRDDITDLGGVGADAIVAVGDGAHVVDPALLGAFATAFDTVGVPLTAVEVDRTSTDPAVRGTALDAVRGDGTLAARISTVDDAEQPAGRIATVLALSALEAGRVGHYGYGRGANAPTPDL